MKAYVNGELYDTYNIKYTGDNESQIEAELCRRFCKEEGLNFHEFSSLKGAMKYVDPNVVDIAIVEVNKYIKNSKKLLKTNKKIGVFEMKKIQNWKTFNENYPPGAANDPRAPYNQKSIPEEVSEFDDFLITSENDEVPVHIKYWYQAKGNDIYITSYEYQINGDELRVDKENLDYDIREIIRDNVGRGNIEFA